MTTTNGPIFSNQRPATGGSPGAVHPQSAIRIAKALDSPARRCPSGLSPRRGFTLIELAVVFAVIAILVTVVAFTARGGRNSAKIKQTRATMDVLKLAMDEYRATRGAYPRPPHYVYQVDSNGVHHHAVCPPTVSGAYGQSIAADYYRQDDEKGHTPDTAPVADYPPKPGSYPRPVDGIWAAHVPGDNLANVAPPFPSNGWKLYSIQGLYYFLMDEPSARQVLDRIKSSFVRADQIKAPHLEWPANTSKFATQGSIPREALAIVDAWGTPLYYGKRPTENNNVPFVQSAGPDGVFSNGDDLYSFKGN